MNGLPDDVSVGPVRLRVANVARCADWLERVLGVSRLGEDAGRLQLGARGGGPLVELRGHAGARPVPEHGRPGLYHYALLLPDRADLGRFLLHLARLGVPHADSDHLVSEAIYLRDPDGITIEVYADRPRDAWRRRGGELAIDTLPLDHSSLAAAAGDTRWERLPDGTRMGHVHHYVGDLAAAERFYADAGLGFAVTTRAFRSALFVSAGGYHHHVGLNTWAAGRPPAGPDDAGLDAWTLVVPGGEARAAIERRLAALAVTVTREDGALTASDPWGITVRIVGGG